MAVDPLVEKKHKLDEKNGLEFSQNLSGRTRGLLASPDDADNLGELKFAPNSTNRRRRFELVRGGKHAFIDARSKTQPLAVQRHTFAPGQNWAFCDHTSAFRLISLV